MPYSYTYPRPAVTVDCIILAGKEKQNYKVVLIKRLNPPYKGKWAFPGGFVDIDEDLLPAAKRELEEETGLRIEQLSQFKAYGKVDRDPRGRTITIVYLGFINEITPLRAKSDAKEAQWFDLKSLPPLAFDHEEILKDFKRIKF